MPDDASDGDRGRAPRDRAREARPRGVGTLAHTVILASFGGPLLASGFRRIAVARGTAECACGRRISATRARCRECAERAVST